MKTLYSLILAAFLACSNSSRTAGVSSDEDTGTISGKLVYSDSLPVPDVQVKLHFYNSSDYKTKTQTREISIMQKSDEAGVFGFDSLQWGNYLVEAIGLYAGVLDTIKICGSDTVHLLLTFRALGEITGTVDSAVINNYESVEVVLPQINRKVTLDDKGNFHVKYLAPFTYSICLMTDDSLLSGPGCCKTVTIGPWSKLNIGVLGTADANTSAHPPQIPANLNARWSSGPVLSIHWETSEYSTRYTLFRYNEESETFDTIYNGTNTFFNDSDVISGKSYTYFVRAENNAGISEKSAALIARTGMQNAQLNSFSIVAPLHNSIYKTGDSIPFQIFATDNNQNLWKILISIDNIPVDSSPIFSFDGRLAPRPKGRCFFRAVGITKEGDSIYSGPIRLFINDIRLGDVNRDGFVDDNDALNVARYTTGMQLVQFDEMSADVNCDGTILITDALLIARFYQEIIDTLPCLGE